MDLLAFDTKRSLTRKRDGVPVALDRREISEMLGDREIEAFLVGGLIQLFDETAADILLEMAGIGRFLDDDRNENRGVSKSCFRFENFENSLKVDEEKAKSWKEQTPVVKSLVLTPLETALLSIDWKILKIRKGEKVLDESEVWREMSEFSENPGQFAKTYAIFRFLKRNGWIVRSGLSFGCEFLIYCLGAQYYHSSAGVLIADVIEPERLLTLTRILAHSKKALIVATTSEDVTNLEDVERADVKIVTMKTYFLERDVAAMSLKSNEIYDL